MGSPSQGQQQRYYSPYEVAQHCSPSDCWVSCAGWVLDVTELVKEHEGPLAEPILRAAGSDISHWFDAKTLEVRTHICPVMNVEQPYCPQGHFIHVLPCTPCSNVNVEFGVPWWRDSQYRKGRLSSECRLIRLKNVLTEQEHTLEVPREDTLAEIRARYHDTNAHACAYIWKAFLRDQAGCLEPIELDMNRTLSENGLHDERAAFEECGLDPDLQTPVLHLYWSDDLTVA